MLIYKLDHTRQKLQQRQGTDVTMKELADELGVSHREIALALQVLSPSISFDAPHEDEGLTLHEKIPGNLGPDDPSASRSLKTQIARSLSRLSAREREVLHLYFGIGVDSDHTLEEIGKRMRITRERVRQIKVQAIKKLQKSSLKDRIGEFCSA